MDFLCTELDLVVGWPEYKMNIKLMQNRGGSILGHLMVVEEGQPLRLNWRWSKFVGGSWFGSFMMIVMVFLLFGKLCDLFIYRRGTTQIQ